jgi:hypothetical protein
MQNMAVKSNHASQMAMGWMPRLVRLSKATPVLFKRAYRAPPFLNTVAMNLSGTKNACSGKGATHELQQC